MEKKKNRKLNNKREINLMYFPIGHFLTSLRLTVI